jgi:hypothetical protein
MLAKRHQIGYIRQNSIIVKAQGASQPIGLGSLAQNSNSLKNI